MVNKEMSNSWTSRSRISTARCSRTRSSPRWSSTGCRAYEIPEDIWITDTTFRDGQQARPPYTVEQQVKIYEMLARLGGPNGIIRQTEFFLYTKNDREAIDRCRARASVPRDHRLDSRRQGRLPPGGGSRTERERHAHQS